MPDLIVIDGVTMYAPKRTATFALVDAFGPPRLALKLIFMPTGVATSFRYFGDQPGLVGCVASEQVTEQSHRLNFRDGAKLAPCSMKYSHHIDGNCHFSENGRALTHGRKRAFSLRSEGRLFEITLVCPAQLPKLVDGPKRRREWHFVQRFPEGLPRAVNIVADWWSLEAVRRISRDVGKPIGPNVELEQHGKRFNRFLVHPQLDALRHGVLAIAAGTVQEPTGDATSTLIFLGGWESDFTPPDAQRVFACAWYPFDDSEQNRALYGSLARGSSP